MLRKIKFGMAGGIGIVIWLLVWQFWPSMFPDSTSRVLGLIFGIPIWGVSFEVLWAIIKKQLRQ